MAGISLPVPNTKARLTALNIDNIPSSDGIVRGSILPKGVAQSIPSKIVALSTLLVFISWPYLVVVLLVASLFSRLALAVAIILFSTLLVPAKLLWTGCTRSYILLTWMEFFNFAWTCETVLTKDDQNVIFAEFPHGAFPFGPILASGPTVIYSPGQKVFALAASAVFYLPGYKHFMSWVGAMPASRPNLAKLLTLGHVAVIMGGIAEMFMLKHDQEEIMLRGRIGAMKTAIETGSPVVPCYHLGNSRVLKFGPEFLKNTSRRMRTAIGFVFGKWGLPIPIQHPIHMVVGLPIKPKKLARAPGDVGYDEELKAAAERLTEELASELQSLYERHRHAVPGWEKRPLTIH